MNTQGNPGRKVLLVDDEPSVCRAVKMLLQHDGFAVQAVNSGEAALALYEREPFDLVITDFFMPGMTGEELAGHIKKIRPDQPIIMATASICAPDADDDPGRLVDCVLTKPFNLQELRAALARVFPLRGPS